MIHYSTPYKDKQGYGPNQRTLFKGDSCHPLSPEKTDPDGNPADNAPMKGLRPDKLGHHLLDESDQIFKICQNIDVDPELDLSFLTDTNQATYMKRILSQRLKKKPLKEKFPYTSNSILQLLEQML
jgi:hypothetical protein